MAGHDKGISIRDDVRPPEAWAAGQRLAKKALAPIERFLSIEASSGIALAAVTLVALAWANSPWGESYAHLWHTPLGFKAGGWAFEAPLHFWVNDGLMTLFFFVVGLEIRREIHRGELSELKRATLPLAAALGGMMAPALLYLAFNPGPTSRGWGVPMATDIAFAVGVLALLGNRVPGALRVLLLALAVIDDVGSILVIAVFYSSGIQWAGLGVAAVGAGAILLQQRLGFRRPLAYAPGAALVWLGAYHAGIHPTLAGVVVGMLTPVRAALPKARFLESAAANVAALEEKEPQDEQAMLTHLDELNRGRKEVVSPVERLQHGLHAWVAYGVMPVFAFANAGVVLGGVQLSGDSARVLLGVLVGLVVGKPVGILAASWLCVRFKLAELPRGVGWKGVAVVGLVGGIGFTMSIFVAQLAFTDAVLLDTAKGAILGASAAAAFAGLLVGRAVLSVERVAGSAASAEEAEASTVA